MRLNMIKKAAAAALAVIMIMAPAFAAFADPVVSKDQGTPQGPAGGITAGSGPVYTEGTVQTGQNLQYNGTGSVDKPRLNNAGLSPELSGGEIRFLKNTANDQQQLAAVIRSSDGKVAVIDGGVEADTDHLYSVICEMGGTVDAWFLTHPHVDHAGGLHGILTQHKDINIKGIYFNLFDLSWYQKYDTESVGMQYVLYEEFNKLPAERIHNSVKRGDVIKLSDNLSVRVLNDPKQSEDNFAGNSSGVMYDITVNGKHLVILGDMGENVGNMHYAEGALENIVCDYVQTAHHGQSGVGEVFYNQVNPKNVIWNTTKKIFENKEKKYQTDKTKQWFSKMNIQNHYSTAEGDVVIK